MNGGMNGPSPVDSRGGYGDPRRSFDDRSSHRSGSGSAYPDSRSGGFSGSNREPVRPREPGGYGDRDRYGSRPRDDDYGSRKRHYEGDGYEDPRSKRRY